MEQQKLSRQEKTGLIWHYLKPVFWSFVAALVTACLSMALDALTPQIIKVTVDSVLGSEALPTYLSSWVTQAQIHANPVHFLWITALGVIAVAVLRGIISYWQRMTMSKGSEGFVKGIRDSLFEHIQHLSFQWHTAHSTGDMIQRCTSDVEVIRNFVCNQMVSVFRTVFLIVLYVSIMFTMNVPLTLLTLAFVPLVGISSGLFYRLISKRFQEADEAEGDLTTCVQENLTGVRVVRAFGRERYEIDRFDQKNDHYANLWIKLGKLMSVYWAGGTVMTCIQVMAVIVAGTILTVRGDMSLGTFLVFVSYNSTLAWPIRNLGRVLSDMSKAGVSLDRVGYILKAPREQDLPDAVAEVPQGDIVFDHVTFGYEEQKVLNDVSFTIPQGSTFAILGGTGSGKSTLVHLIDRLYDLDEGQGCISIGGTDIRLIQREQLRRHVGLVLQEPFLFSKTIAENIAATHPGAEQAELRKAASIACVDEAITEFPEGYDTIIGERGVTLSGGQKQRVAIARMLMQQASIMIFDDSLSAVDAETDAKIRAALRERLGAATVILISHRVTTLIQADQILVLEHGRVADIGTHAELIGRPGIYQDIYNIQMQSDDRKLIAEGGAD